MTYWKRLTVLLILGLSACGGGGGNSNDSGRSESSAEAKNKALLNQIVNSVIVPSVSTFNEEAKKLVTSTQAFCATGGDTAANLDALQDSWKALSKSWYALAVFNAGPLDTLKNTGLTEPRYFFIDALRVRGTDYTSTVKTRIRNSLKDSANLTEAYFKQRNFNQMGLLALEYLIFEDSRTEGETSVDKVLADYKANSRKCVWLNGVSKELAGHAQAVFNGWNSNYQGTGKPYKTLFVNGQADGITVPLATVFVEAQTQFDYLKGRNPVVIAAKISDDVWNSISGSINQGEKMLNGNGVSPNIRERMVEAGAQSVLVVIDKNFADARSAIQSKNQAELEAAFGRLDGNFKRDIPNALGVTIGITFSDGD